MTDEQILDAFRSTQALLEGHFVLRSGLHSRQFFQCARLLTHPRRAAELCAALSAKHSAHKHAAAISPAMGGILVGHEVARNLDLPHYFAEKANGLLVVRRFELPPVAYIVAEDVVTTGSAVREVCEIVRGAGGTVAAVGCIVDRSGNNPPDLGAPLVSLLKMNVETFPAEALPHDLAATPAIKPGSR